MDIDSLIKKIEKKEWIFDVSRKFAWFVEDIQSQFASPKIKVRYSLYFPFSFLVENYLILNGDEFYPEEDRGVERLYHFYQESFEKSDRFFEKFYHQEIFLVEKLNIFLEEFKRTNFSKLTNKELQGQLRLFTQAYLDSFLPAFLRPDNFIEKLIRQSFKEEQKFGQPKIEKLLELISTAHSLEKLRYAQESLDLLYLIKGIKLNKKELVNLPVVLQKKLQSYAIKYGWLKNPEGVELAVFTLDDYKKRIISLLKSDVDKKIRGILEGRKKFEKNYQLFLKKYQPSRRLRFLTQALRDFIFLRTYTTEISQEIFFTGRTTLLKEISQRLNLISEEIVSLSSEEVDQILIGNKQINVKQIINNRQKGFAIIILDKKVNNLFGQEALKIRHVLQNYLFGLDKTSKKVVQIKGAPASRGKAKGRVAIVLNHRDISKVEKDNILVATMTTPEFTIAMERAAAFITDEGGVTCHAAIIARELGVPCIVGTKNATKILKDGDLVEVDANLGIVKVLSK